MTPAGFTRADAGRLDGIEPAKGAATLQNLKFLWDRVLVSYLLFLATFGATVFVVLTAADQAVIVTAAIASVFAALVVVVLNMPLHQAIQALRPDQKSLGLAPALAAFVCFSPFEAALIVGAFNLLIGLRAMIERRRYQALLMPHMNLRRRA